MNSWRFSLIIQLFSCLFSFLLNFHSTEMKREWGGGRGQTSELRCVLPPPFITENRTDEAETKCFQLILIKSHRQCRRHRRSSRWMAMAFVPFNNRSHKNNWNINVSILKFWNSWRSSVEDTRKPEHESKYKTTILLVSFVSHRVGACDSE